MWFLPTGSCARSPRVFHVLFFALLLLGASSVVFAQGGVGSSRGLPSSASGSNSIKGRVYFPVEPQSGRRIRVRLTSTDLLNQTAVTDEDGSFAFNEIGRAHV